MKWILIIFFGSAFLYGFLKIPIEAYKKARREAQEQEHKRRSLAFQAQQERELQETVRQYLRSGKKIDAIKECKDYYDCSLSKAKTIVSEIEFEMAYEREHSEEYRPYAHGRAYKDEPAGQPVNSPLSYSSRIDGMDGHEFEHFCADLLLKTGFDKADVTPGSGDQGVDIVAVKDGLRYAIQCKNYASPLSNTPVQEVNAGKDYYNCHVAAVMTNSTFTPGAQKLADANRVLLWDRAYVEKLMEKAGFSEPFSNSSSADPSTYSEDCYEYETSNKRSDIISPTIKSLEYELQNDFLHRYGFNSTHEKNKYTKKECNKKTKTLLLCIFLGTLGVHRFYLGKICTGIVWLLTYGCFGIGWIVDIILIASNKMTDSEGNVIENAKLNDLSEADIALLEMNYWMNQILDEPPGQLMAASEQLATAVENHTAGSREIHEISVELFRYCQQIKFLSVKYKEACYRFFQMVLDSNTDGWTTEDSFLAAHQKLRNIVSGSFMNTVNQLETFVINHSSYRGESESLQLVRAGKYAIDDSLLNIDLAMKDFEKMKCGIAPMDA